MGRAASMLALGLVCVLALWVAPAAEAGQVLRVDGKKVTRVDDPSVPSRAAGDLGPEPVFPRASAAKAKPGAPKPNAEKQPRARRRCWRRSPRRASKRASPRPR